MKTYQVLCKTCGGSGFIQTPRHMEASTPLTDICPVCNGNKTQWIYETDDISILIALQNGSISLSDAIRIMQ